MMRMIYSHVLAKQTRWIQFAVRQCTKHIFMVWCIVKVDAAVKIEINVFCECVGEIHHRHRIKHCNKMSYKVKGYAFQETFQV